MSAQEIESIVTQIKRLSPEDQLRLIKRVTEMLNRGESGAERHRLTYGKYKDAAGRLSREEDFKIAEWHPTEKDLNGP
jgi:hypothetical protein